MNKLEFLDKDNILYKFQPGFRKIHSIDFNLSYLKYPKVFALVFNLPLQIYDAEFHKDLFLDLCYFCCL